MPWKKRNRGWGKGLCSSSVFSFSPACAFFWGVFVWGHQESQNLLGFPYFKTHTSVLTPETRGNPLGEFLAAAPLRSSRFTSSKDWHGSTPERRGFFRVEAPECWTTNELRVGSPTKLGKNISSHVLLLFWQSSRASFEALGLRRTAEGPALRFQVPRWAATQWNQTQPCRLGSSCRFCNLPAVGTDW